MNRFCRGCGSNWDVTTKYPWPSTSTKVSYCPRCLIDKKVQPTVPMGSKDQDRLRLAAFDRKIANAKLAAGNEAKAENSARHSRFFKGILGAADGGDAAWGYAAAGNAKHMPRRDRMKLASLKRIRRWFLLQTELKFATKWERRKIAITGSVRNALFWSTAIAITTIVILIAVLSIYSMTHSVE